MTMDAYETKAGGVAGRPAFYCNNDTSSRTDRVPNPQAGKRLAILLYNVSAGTCAETQAAFARHPEWRSA